ncbi:MAG TPA: aspartyl protease family protein [Caulobacteraceae bacterium]|jgi:predicted aspartyl protease|nr:aspartyl protease family protein [Caulobacteraceae bacterium]
MLDRRQGLKGALALAGLAAAGRSARAAGPTIVALSEQRNRFLIAVEINGAAGYRFVLDTGASTHFISARLVEALDLPEVDRRMAKGYGGRQRESVVGLRQLTVGGVSVGKVDAVVWPQERLEDHDGLIGYPFLFPHAVLNLSAAEISFDGAASEAMVPVPAQVMRNQTLLLGGVGGVEGRFVFDTGAQNCTISEAYLRRIASTEVFRAAAKLGRRTGDGETSVAAFRPEEIAFGAFRIPNPTIRVAGAEGSGNLFDGVDGLFGVSLIKPYAWALDQAARSLKVGPYPA